MDKPTINVVGLGRLGAAIAAAWAAAGYRVYGVDVSDRVIEMINAGEPPIAETGLAEALAAAEGRLTASKATAQAVLNSDVTFIIVPTPSNEKGRFVLDYVLPACKQIALGLAAKDAYHMVVVTSTVMPGDTNGPIRAILEKESGKKCGQDFGLAYSPEFVRLGSVEHDFLDPDFVLIGASDEETGTALEDLYLDVLHGAPPVFRMSLWNAETAKLALNDFMTLKISFANMLAEFCMTDPTGNVDAITAALGADRRIAELYFRGGLPFGGPCFPRDTNALAYALQEAGVNPLIPQAVDTFNTLHLYHLLTMILKLTAPDRSRVGILGLAYKTKTPVIDESPGVKLAQALCECPGFPAMDGRASYKIDVTAYDPAAIENVRALKIPGLVLAETLEDCVRQSDILIVMMTWSEFECLTRMDLCCRVIVDCWRMFDPESFPGAQYIGYGLGEKES